MPSISFSPHTQMGDVLELPWPERVEVLRLWMYRVGIYGVMNLLDDPAWLALMFC